MYKRKIEAKKLKKVIKDLPEKYNNKILEVTIKEYMGNELSRNTVKIANKIRKRAVNRNYIGKNNEVFFFDSENISIEERKDLENLLKSYGYKVSIKEGQRNVLVINVSWDKANI